MYGSAIKKLRLKNKITQVELANVLNVKQSTIAMWETDKREPDLETIKKISSIFNVTPNDMLGVFHVVQEQKRSAIRIPVLGKIPAGVPIDAIEDIIDFEEVPAHWGKGGKEYFALQLDGDSMYPKYINGDVVIFQKADDCDSGIDCAVIVNGFEATFKKLIKQPNGIVLQPLNTSMYESTFYSNVEVEELPLRVIGIAKEIRRRI